MKTDGEVRALSVYAALHGISDRLILSLAPAAGLVPPPKPAFTVVLGGECCFFIGDGLGGACLRRLKTFLKKGLKNPKNFQKRVYENRR